MPDAFVELQASGSLPSDADIDDYIYTPIFIDLIDDFNQTEYYNLWGQDTSIQDDSTETNVMSNVFLSIFPVDRIRNMPPSLVEDIIFNNTSIDGIKASLEQYAQEHPTEAAEYNLTEQNINQLFYYYERANQ